MTNQTTRVLELLKRFNKGKKVCIEILKNDLLWEGKSEKTIRRDLDVIKEVFPQSFELIRGEKGCYRAFTQKAFEEFLDERNLSLLIQVFYIAQQSNLFKSFEIDEVTKRLIEAKIREKKKIYEFKSKPFETKKSSQEIIHQLEHSIYHQKYIEIGYVVRDRVEKYELKPYKILFMNENFYLACEVKHKNFSFSLYRLSKIKNVDLLTKNFHKNLEIEDFIKTIQTPFARYQKAFRKHLVKVILEVDGSKAYFFKSKKFLSSQEIVETKENGSLIISYEVTQEMEIEELVKRWLPYVRVIEPLSLKKKLEKELKKYLKK